MPLETDGRGSPAEAENVADTISVALVVGPEVPSRVEESVGLTDVSSWVEDAPGTSEEEDGDAEETEACQIHVDCA